MNLRPYQIENANKAHSILSTFRVVYMAFEVRTGKTLTSLEVARLYNAKNVLFLTKKKAIESIQNDYNNFNYSQNFELTVANYESLHKVTINPDLVICDEAHTLSAFPKPSKRTKEIKQRFGNKSIILMSGTPDAESSSQWYHQFWVSNFSPFSNYSTFYKWAKDYVNVTQRHLGYGVVNDYSDGRTSLIERHLHRHVIRYSQQQAGFTSKVEKIPHYVEMTNRLVEIEDRIVKNKCFVGRDDSIIADTAAKMLQKRHQLSGGTIILESGKGITLDKSKARYILQTFSKKKIAIFYYFKQELELLKDAYGNLLTEDLEEFNTTNKWIALQQYSGAEGINLSKADDLVFYNWGMSGSKFIQAIDRMTTKDREHNRVHFIITKHGVSEQVLNSVMKKETYTASKYQKDYGF